MLKKPMTGDYPDYYKAYIDLVPDDILPFLKTQKTRFLDLLDRIPIEKREYAYAQGKWTLKQSIIHVIEVERIFAYRSLTFSRFDPTVLASFDQDDYVSKHDSKHLDWEFVRKDFELSRSVSIHQFDGYNDEQWDFKGALSMGVMINKALPYMIAGHTEHHMRLTNDLYLS